MLVKGLSITHEVQKLLDAGAPLAVGVSGGKDSQAVSWALSQFLRDYEGPKILVHSDLGTVEWLDSLPACRRIAERIGWPHCVPTAEESRKLAEMRRSICAFYGWDSPYLDVDTVQQRYQELWDLKHTK
jgi:tRNA(Ile)-lysidine synthase TilS/MesJ